MTGIRLFAIAFAIGAGVGVSGAILAVNVSMERPMLAESAKDQQIAALTLALSQLRQQLLSDKMEREEEERRIKARNAPPLHIAPPQTFQGGFQ